VKILILIGVIVAVGFVVLMLVAVRPRKGQQHVIYKLEGPAGHWAVVTTDGKDRDTVSLPWTLSVWVPRGKSVELAAEFQEDSDKGSLDAKVYLDGQLMQSAHASGGGTATVRVTVP
jgi:hypothetical protein